MKDKYYTVHIYEVSRTVKFMKSRWEWRLPGPGGRWKWESLITGIKFQLKKMNML